MVLNLRRVSDHEIMRLDAIRSHLGLDCDPADLCFQEAVIGAVVKKLSPIVKKAAPKTGEELVAVVAKKFGVRFEVVREEADIQRLKKHYVESRREIGFTLLDDELADPHIDALLFQLGKPDETDARYVAVLNLQRSRDREYWNGIHELSHRLAEPPQMTLPFRRHPAERSSPIERLVDGVAAEIAFYGPIFEPVVRQFSKVHPVLTLRTVSQIKEVFCPTASFLSVANAVAKIWPIPTVVLVADWRGRIQNGKQSFVDEALRVAAQGHNNSAFELKMIPWPNMCVPETSPLYSAYHDDRFLEDSENLGHWTTSKGLRMPSIEVVTSAKRFGQKAYAILSMAKAA